MKNLYFLAISIKLYKILIELTNQLSNTTVYSQSNHLAEIRGLLEDAELDLRRTIRDRGYIYNSYLSEE